MTEYKKSGFLRIPHALLDSIDTKRCGLFIGSGISINSGLPSWHNLILELMNSCIDYGISSKEQNELNHLLNQGAFLEVADYSREKMGNRRFHDIMQKLFRSPNIETNEIHDLIINLNFPLIITTNYDKLLEKAFTYTYPGEVPPVYTYKNTASLARLLGESEFFILKIHGDIDDVGTIILTKKDYRKVLSENPACRVTLFNLFASYSFLFLGFSIKDPDLNLILEDLSVTFGGFARRHFALMQDPGDILSKSFSNNYNVEIMPYTSNIEHGKAVYNFLIELKKLIKNRPHKHKYETKSRKSITHPYKFLDFYDVDDSVIFFGREREVAEIIDLINARDITTLTGKSGVGKTSLVKAGLFPKFISNDYIPLYVRSSSNMISAFDSAFPRQTYDNIIDTPPMTKPTDLFTELKRLSDSDEIIIVLDQFEEFFIRLDKKARNPWIEVLSRLIHDESLLIKLIIVIREDFLVELNELKVNVPSIFNNMYRLKILTLDEARKAICEPALKFGIKYESTLLNELLDSMYSDGVEPAHLQIVCCALYDSLLPDDKKITKLHYDSLGGARKIIANHVSRVLGTLRRQDKEIAKFILKQLVTYVQTKALVTFNEILDSFNNQDKNNV